MPVSVSTLHRSLSGAAAFFVLAGLVCLAGCGGSDPQGEPAASETRSDESDNSPVEQAPPARTPTRGNPTVAMKDSRTRWINDIPYDAFFERPLDVVRDQTPVGTAPDVTPVETDPSTEPAVTAVDPMPPVEPGEGSEIDWAERVSVELLNEAVTDIRTRLTANLQTLAAYNRSWTDIALDGHTLSALAAAIEKHPDAVSWKENAKYVRDLGYEIYLKADGTGRDAYEPTQLAFESVITILNGGPPPDLDSDDLASFADVIDRSVMMQQFEKTFNWLKADVNTESRLEEDADRVAREASLLVAFGTILLDEGYDFSDEPDYQAFVQEFVNGNREMVSASRSELPDYEAFQSGRNAVQTSCGVCHQKYQGSSSEF